MRQGHCEGKNDFFLVSIFRAGFDAGEVYVKKLKVLIKDYEHLLVLPLTYKISVSGIVLKNYHFETYYCKIKFKSWANMKVFKYLPKVLSKANFLSTY